MCSFIASCVGYSVHHNATQSAKQGCSLSLESRQEIDKLVDLANPGLVDTPGVRWGWRTPPQVGHRCSRLFEHGQHERRTRFDTVGYSTRELGCARVGDRRQHRAGLGMVFLAVPRQVRARDGPDAEKAESEA